VRTDLAKTPTNAAELTQLGRRTHEEEQGGASLSGFERDHLFLSSRGTKFSDIAGISGLDDPADGRCFGIIDYDHDGWPDIALVNANAPMLELYRNRIGAHPATLANPAGGRMIALRFVGGNHKASPSRTSSARDGIGARVTVDLGDTKLLREYRAGEGFATENSATLIVGVGEHALVPSVTVRWPAGSTEVAKDVAAGTLLTVYENPSQSPGGTAFASLPYLKVASRAATQSAAAPGGATARTARRPFPIGPAAPDAAAAALRVYTTMAAWCTACRGEIPQYDRLRAAFGTDEVAFYGVPIDPAEGREKIESWGRTNHPAYVLMTGLSGTQVSAVKDLVLDRLKFDAVPATFITDGDGGLLASQWGPPTISRIRELLAGVRAAPAAAPAPSGTSATAPAKSTASR
jgi:thiol-disulfide isomerase/thioredoxin